MSLATWKRHYYPKPADETDESEAVAHSLKKWRGLLPAVLEKHELKHVGCVVRDKASNVFDVDADSCALCIHHFAGDCRDCPLYAALGNNPCYESGQPYLTFKRTGDPEPMIAALKKAAELEAKK